MLAIAGRFLPRARHYHTVATIVGAVSAIGLLLYPAIAVWYASDPHFYDMAEPTIVSVAWIYLQGAPIYHAVDSAERYSHIYGPMTFIVHAWAQGALGPSIGVSKWLGVLAGTVSLALIFGSLVRVCAVYRAAALTGLGAMILLAFRNFSYWTRPDSLQLFCAALSLFCVAGRGGITSVIIAGVASGVLWNLKITGVLYSLPVFVLLVKRSGARSALAWLAIGLAIAIAPFFLANVSLANYLTWIRLSGQTGLMLSLLRQNLEWAAYLCAPLLLARTLTGRPALDDRHVVAALAAGVLLVVVAAAKPGAGPYHLFPFVPAIMLIAGARLGNLPISSPRALAMEAMAGWTCVLVLIVASQSAYLATVMGPRRAADDVEDVRAFLAGHDGIVEMGYGRTEAKSLIRPLLTFSNNSYLIDQPAVREYELQGLELPSATIDALRQCRVAYWLIPKGEEPFSGVNVYRSVEMKPLYPPQLRAAFADTHQLTATTAYYDVWQCTAGVRQ